MPIQNHPPLICRQPLPTSRSPSRRCALEFRHDTGCRDLLTGGDLEDGAALTAVEQKIAAAQRSHGGLTEALTLVDERLSAANVRLSELREAAEREQLAAALTAEADALATAAATFADAG